MLSLGRVGRDSAAGPNTRPLCRRLVRRDAPAVGGTESAGSQQSQREPLGTGDRRRDDSRTNPRALGRRGSGAGPWHRGVRARCAMSRRCHKPRQNSQDEGRRAWTPEPLSTCGKATTTVAHGPPATRGSALVIGRPSAPHHLASALCHCPAGTPQSDQPARTAVGRVLYRSKA
jgi:hypothetical protein